MAEDVAVDAGPQPSETPFLDAAEAEAGATFDPAPLRHIIYEQLAHRTSYVQFPQAMSGEPDVARTDAFKKPIPRWNATEQERVTELGYDVAAVHEDRLTGFQCVLFTPNANGVEVRKGDKISKDCQWLVPVLSFRGSQDHESWADDYNESGIGAQQFRLNEARIAKLMSEGAMTTGKAKVDLTGHSLGGALAQTAAAHYPSLVGDVVTFQSPAIDADDAKRAEKAGVSAHHYRVEQDIVPLSGEEFIPGEERTFRMFSTEGYGDAHVAWPLETLNTRQAAEPGMFSLPALTRRDERHIDGRGMNELTQRNLGDWSGVGEKMREWRMGQKRSDHPEDHLNGPITRLAERLRAKVADWKSRTWDLEIVETQIREYVAGQKDRCMTEAVLRQADLDGLSDDSAAWALLAPSPVVQEQVAELEPHWDARAVRLTDETIELLHLHADGAIQRVGW